MANNIQNKKVKKYNSKGRRLSKKIFQMSAAGKSQTQIAAGLSVHRHTVQKIIKTQDMGAARRQAREKLYSLLDKAVDTVALSMDPDTALTVPDLAAAVSYKFLKDTSVIDSAKDRMYEQVADNNHQDITIQTEEDLVEVETGKLAYMTMHMAKVFNQPLPHTDKSVDEVLNIVHEKKKE